MRIGFDAKRLFFNTTGLGNYSRTLIKNLLRYSTDNEYFLFTPKPVNHHPFLKSLSSENVHIQLIKGYLKNIQRSWFLSSQIEALSLDIYHGLSNEIPIVSSKNKNTRYIVTIHDLIFLKYPETYPFIDRNIYHKKVKRSCRDADKIIAISQSAKKDIMEHYSVPENKIEVVYQSCDDVFYQAIPPDEAIQIKNKYQLPKAYLLFVGSIQERKNLQLILQAYPLLKKDLQIPLVVVGRGRKYKKKLYPIIEQHQLRKHIIWIENCFDNRDLKVIYENAQMLIYPSYYEGFGLPVAEALLSKTPVITSHTSSLPEAGGPGALYIDPRNKEELAQTIEKLLTNHSLKKKLVEEGYLHAMQNFSPEKTTEKIVNLYHHILKS